MPADKVNAGWKVAYTIAGAGEKTITFKTENTFVDADIFTTITTPSASNPSLTLTNKTGALSMGTASSGVYSPTVDVSGSATVGTAGWIAADDYTVVATNFKVGTVNQSTMKNGNSLITSGSTINPGPSNQTITISEGYNAARTLIIGSTSASNPGAVTSGSATVSALTYTYSSTNSNFTISGSADVSAPTVGTAGYVSGSIGTLNANTGGATVAATVDKIAIQANLSGTGTKQPTITKNSATNIPGASAATTTKPSSGYYIAVSSAKNTANVQATASVTTAGYGTATSGQYTTTPSSSLEVGAAASAVTYVPIPTATFANAATSGTTYTDISSSAPALISGDYLYINAGYTPASKISLAKLVPDATDTNAAANYILENYTAYDNDGTLIVGTMATYAGTYTVT